MSDIRTLRGAEHAASTRVRNSDIFHDRRGVTPNRARSAITDEDATDQNTHDQPSPSPTPTTSHHRRPRPAITDAHDQPSPTPTTSHRPGRHDQSSPTPTTSHHRPGRHDQSSPTSHHRPGRSRPVITDAHDQPPPTRTLTTSHHRPRRSRPAITDQPAHRTRAAGSNASLNSRTHCLKCVDTFRLRLAQPYLLRGGDNP